jgi:cytochrome c biogenesis protein CcmG, thiol:disulfide interchange protein DsbE
VNRWLAVLPLVALVALAVVFVGWSLRRDPGYKPDALVGRAVPAVSLAPLPGGAPVDLSSVAAGRPRVINLFASWCAPCRIEHPNLEKLRARGVEVVGVAYKDNPVATRAYLQELGDPYAAVLMDPEGQAGLDLGVSGVPETFAVDASGVIVAKASGPLVTDADVGRLAEALGR